MSYWTLLTLLLLLGLGVALWSDGMRARERARAASGQACRRYGVQLLDDTVALERIWPCRDERGRLRLERTYVFEFSDDQGLTRRHGSVVLLGGRVQVLYMEPGDLFIP